jgi:hypothetical protein
MALVNSQEVIVRNLLIRALIGAKGLAAR